MRTARSINFLIAGLVFIPLVAQYMGLVNTDSAWLLHVASRVISGQVLYRDIIETNPPLIVYLMLIPAHLAELTGLSIMLWFKVFTFALAAFSCFLCYRLHPDKKILALVIFALVFFAGPNFGQREHYFIILFLPYLFSLTAKHVSNGNKILTAFMAGIAISLKPYFLIIWIAVVLADTLTSKDFRKIFVLQNWVIGLTGLFYICWIYVCEREYVEQVLPQLKLYYALGFDRPIIEIAKQALPQFILAQFAMVVTLIKFPKSVTREAKIYSICHIAAIITYVVQQKAFTNHFVPADFFAILLNFALLEQLLKLHKKPWKIGAIGVCLVAIVQLVAIAAIGNFRVGARYSDANVIRQITYINKMAAGRNVYYLSCDLPDAFPAILYSEGVYNGKYGHLWMLPGMYADGDKDDKGEFIYNNADLREDDEIALIHTVRQEMQAYRPEIVLVKESKNYESAEIGSFKINFVKYFSQDQEFANLWRYYEKVATIGEVAVYRYNPDIKKPKSKGRRQYFS